MFSTNEKREFSKTNDIQKPEGNQTPFFSNSTVKKGENFGSFSFFTDEKRDLSVKSVNITHIACLTKHDFIETIKDFPDDFVEKKKFKTIEINRKFRKNLG